MSGENVFLRSELMNEYAEKLNENQKFINIFTDNGIVINMSYIMTFPIKAMIQHTQQYENFIFTCPFQEFADELKSTRNRNIKIYHLYDHFHKILPVRIQSYQMNIYNANLLTPISNLIYLLGIDICNIPDCDIQLILGIIDIEEWKNRIIASDKVSGITEEQVKILSHSFKKKTFNRPAFAYR